MTHPGPSHPGPSGPSQPSAPTRGHSHESGWVGPSGECGISCSCGVAFDGFDTIAEAAALLDRHIADSLPTPGRGHLPIGASPAGLPRLGELIRDAERLAAQLLAVLNREYDSASAPTDLAWPGASELTMVDLHMAHAASHVQSVLRSLARITELQLPAAGSAVPVVFPQPGDGSGSLICVGKSMADGVGAVCSRADVHELHRVGQDPPGEDSRVRSGGPGTTAGVAL